MKKLLLIMLLAFGMNAFSQTTVYYLNSDPSLNTSNPKNVGDASYIGLDYTMNTNDSFQVYAISTSLIDNGYDTCHNRIKISTYKVFEIIAWQTYSYGSNTAYKMSFIVPNVPTGNYHLKVRGYGNCSINYSCPNCSTPPVFAINNNVGIESYQSNSKDDFFYFEYGVYKIKVSTRTKEKFFEPQQSF